MRVIVSNGPMDILDLEPVKRLWLAVYHQAMRDIMYYQHLLKNATTEEKKKQYRDDIDEALYEIECLRGALDHCGVDATVVIKKARKLVETGQRIHAYGLRF